MGFVINKTFDRTSQASQSKQEHLYHLLNLQNGKMLHQLGGAVFFRISEFKQELTESNDVIL